MTSESEFEGIVRLLQSDIKISAKSHVLNLKLHKHVPPARLTQTVEIATNLRCLPPLKTCLTVEQIVIMNLDRISWLKGHREFDVQQGGLARDLAAPCFNYRRTTLYVFVTPHNHYYTQNNKVNESFDKLKSFVLRAVSFFHLVQRRF